MAPHAAWHLQPSRRSTALRSRSYDSGSNRRRGSLSQVLQQAGNLLGSTNPFLGFKTTSTGQDYAEVPTGVRVLAIFSAETLKSTSLARPSGEKQERFLTFGVANVAQSWAAGHDKNADLGRCRIHEVNPPARTAAYCCQLMFRDC
jgi:hypothetical protein